MTKQTICDPVLLISERILENFQENLLDFRKTLVDLRKLGKEFVSKNCHAEETNEKSISNTL